MTVAEVQELYLTHAVEMFTPARFYRRFWNKFDAAPNTNMLKLVFSEDGEGKVPATLGTSKLRTLLTLVMRNHSTGSPWPVSNNPAAKFNSIYRLSPVCTLLRPSFVATGSRQHRGTGLFPAGNDRPRREAAGLCRRRNQSLQ